MKKIILFLILLFLSTLICFSQLAKDKQDHLFAGFLVGFSTSCVTYVATQNHLKTFAWSMGSTALIGGGKELIYDKWMGKGTPEWSDFAADMVGGIIGCGIFELFSLTDKSNGIKKYNRIAFKNAKTNYKGIKINVYLSYQFHPNK